MIEGKTMTNTVKALLLDGGVDPYMTLLDGLEYARSRIVGIRFRAICLPEEGRSDLLERWDVGFPLTSGKKARLLAEVLPFCESMMVRLSVSPSAGFVLYADASIADLAPDTPDPEVCEALFHQGAGASWPADPILPSWAAMDAIENCFRHAGNWSGLGDFIENLGESDVHAAMHEVMAGAHLAIGKSADISKALVENFIDDIEACYGLDEREVENAMVASMGSELMFISIVDLLNEAMERDVIGMREADILLDRQRNMIRDALNKSGPDMEDGLIVRLLHFLEEYEVILASHVAGRVSDAA